MQYGGQLSTLHLLLNSGANVKKKDNEGHNALHFAASCNKEFCRARVDMMRALFNYDALQPRNAAESPDQRTQGEEETIRARTPGTRSSLTKV